MTPSSEDIILCLKQARFKIEEGWCQNNFAVRRAGPGYRYCAIGALRVVTHGGISFSHHDGTYSQRVFADLVNVKAIEVLAKAVPAPERPHCYSGTIDPNAHIVANYNDKRGRTQEEMLTLFDRAIESVP